MKTILNLRSILTMEAFRAQLGTQDIIMHIILEYGMEE